MRLLAKMSNEGEGEEAGEEAATLQKQGRRRSGAALHARLLLSDCASAGSRGRVAIPPLIPHHLLISATCQQLRLPTCCRLTSAPSARSSFAFRSFLPSRRLHAEDGESRWSSVALHRQICLFKGHNSQQTRLAGR